MSQNNQQRPTPETDALHLKQGLTHANYREFARKLERERDEAREKFENTLNVIIASTQGFRLTRRKQSPRQTPTTGEMVADYILGMQKFVGRVHALYFNDKQQLEAMREAIKEARDLLLSLEHEGNEKGTRCISCGSHCSEPHKESCNMLSALAKLQPFLKTKGILPSQTNNQ